MDRGKKRKEPSTADIKALLLGAEVASLFPPAYYHSTDELTSRYRYLQAKKLKGLKGVRAQKSALANYIYAVHNEEISPGERLAVLSQLPVLLGMRKLKHSLNRSAGSVSRSEVESLLSHIPTKGEPLVLHGAGAAHSFYAPRKEYLTAPEWWITKYFRKRKKDFISPEAGLISIPQNAGPEAAAHEIGHASFRTKWPGRLVGKLRTPALLLGAPAAIMIPKLTDPDSKLSKAAPAIGALAMAPTLIDEMAASTIGIKGMRAAGFPENVIRQGKKNVAKAFGTYALATVPFVAAPYILRKLRKRALEERQKKGLPTTTDLLQEWKNLKRREQRLEARQR